MPVIGGTVFDSAGAPVDRELRFYRRDTGAFLGRSQPSGGDGDPDFDKVSLLLHCDGADSSTAFADSSPAPKAITAYGNAKISTAQSKWGGSSGYFDSAGDYLFSPSSAAFGFGTADYTVECWIKTLDNDGVIFDNRPLGPPGFTIFTNASGFGYYDTSGVNITSGTFITDGQWHHVAACRSAGTLRLFVDGAQKVSASSTYDLGTSNPVYIAIASGGSAAPLQCNIDDLRITKGVARYTANFTPPAAPFPDTLNPGRTMPLGEYYFVTDYTGEVQVVCIDDVSEPLENDLILRTFPV